MLVSLIIVLLIVGAMLYVLPMLPIDATVKTIIQVIVIVGGAIWLLKRFGGVLG